MKLEEKAPALSDAAGPSERIVSRRSLLGMIGIGAGVGAATVFGPARPVGAAVFKRNTGDVGSLGSVTETKKDPKKQKSLKGKAPKGSTSKP
jgi:hypothetical protein